MKTCEEYAALLDMYVDGFCTDEESAQVRAHLAVCESCRLYVEQILQMKEAFPDAEETEVPAGFADGVMEAIRAQTAQKKRMKPWQKTLVQMAACLALVIALGPLSAVLTGGNRGAAESASVAPMAPAAYGAKDSFALADEAEAGGLSRSESYSDASTAAQGEWTAPAVPAEPGAAPASSANPSSSVVPYVPSGAMVPGETAEDSAAEISEKLKVVLTRTQMEDILGGYTGTPWGEFVVYELSAVEMDAVLEKFSAGNVIPGMELESIRGKDCALIVYLTE